MRILSHKPDLHCLFGGRMLQYLTAVNVVLFANALGQGIMTLFLVHHIWPDMDWV
jgi:hypothetical protein